MSNIFPSATTKLEAEYAKKKNNHIFINRSLHTFKSNTGFYGENYYVLRDGIVYEIQDGKEIPSGDRIESLYVECEDLGVYDAKKVRKAVRLSFDLKSAKQLLKKINKPR